MSQELQTVCYRVQLKADSLDSVYEWSRELNGRQPEALQTLEEEGIFLESVFLERTDTGNYLIYYMKMRDPKKAAEIFAASKHPIDEYHRNFQRATWEKGERLELLLDLDRMKLNL
ncbi:DUF6176 family protein [Flavilitoribacter nigricans]|uniref:NIPSNAP domain-containing protein n=1 Tax=Flavilitoribacter nigricans (strain ATCC 23147 / DSM 23189 / NBRC 102662 / NCIMB 1420 / SS-2) TaxID=1122177 RepID=A0A2D0NG30_FLAN2|nr:DUF6176 family protein [Flavilitoribacter nigricans]PHN07368.1 hypothetical protein CRP01_06985 [Flavilitoribacter nigricans DSM 23189 = NBRC 102662]